MAANVLNSPEAVAMSVHVVRGRRVMLDADLARFYDVGTRDRNKAVGRNLERFPDDFAFMLTAAKLATITATADLRLQGRILRPCST